MSGAAARRELGEFNQGVADFATPALRARGIETMVRLAFEATVLKIREWAAVWLSENVNVLITAAETAKRQEDYDAVTPAAVDLLR